MTLPASGTLTMDMIRAEFGGSYPIVMSEYYAGGPRVVAGTTGTYGPVPSSGTISFANFYGVQKALDIQFFTPQFNPSDPNELGYQNPAWIPPGFGSLSDAVFNPTGTRINRFSSFGSSPFLLFQVDGGSGVPETSWNVLTIPNVGTYPRTSASYDGFGSWIWTTGGFLFTAGANYQLVFT